MRNKNKKYMIRRLIAIVVLIVVLFLIIKSVKAVLFKNKNLNENEPTENTALAKSNSEMEENIEVINFNELLSGKKKEEVLTNSGEKIDKDLLIYRQRTLRDHSMGRKTKQSLLKKQVFLTFDDGPSSENTEKILDILKEKQVPATFFVVGKNAKRYPEIVKREHAEGHYVANHSYSHDYKKIYASTENFIADMKEGEAAVKEILGEDYTNNVYRFPGGSFGDKKKPYREKLEEMGYTYFDWNVLNGDAEGANPTPEYLLNRFNETSKGYNVIISLMHDTNAKDNTVETLPQIIDSLKEKGYEFKTLGDL